MPEEETGNRCERCDRETERLMKYVGPDNSVEYVCSDCVTRKEKRVNLKETWKRGGRAR
jgi:ribosome-binding protein aMBF1 (putative translation factor)